MALGLVRIPNREHGRSLVVAVTFGHREFSVHLKNICLFVAYQFLDVRTWATSDLWAARFWLLAEHVRNFEEIVIIILPFDICFRRTVSHLSGVPGLAF